MDISLLIQELSNKGIKLSLDNDDLKIQAPKGVISPEIKEQLSINKSEIINYLKNNDSYNNLDFSLFFFASDDSIEDNSKYKLIIDASIFADNNNFKGIWTPERHFNDIGGLSPNPSIIASALSTITKNIKLRAGSVVLPLHDPIRVVEEWSVIDNISNGRIELSFASGWHIDDFVFSPDKYFNRKEYMFNEIDIIKKLWSGESIERKNGGNKIIKIFTHPKPIQKDLPIWVTAIGNPDTYIKAAEGGYNLMTCLLDQDIYELEEKIKIYKNTLEKNGYDSNSKKIAVFTHTFIGDDYEQVIKKVKKPFTNYLEKTLNLIGKIGQSTGIEINTESMNQEDKETVLNFAFDRYIENRTLIGTKDSCFKTLKQLEKIGVNEIACLIDFGLSYSDVMGSLNLLKKYLAQ
ncbi:MAG: MupA/Atu3671 family FMN-dependent luciferase-like monooxygenase [Candidatus Sericytochromatia bacterium]